MSRDRQRLLVEKRELIPSPAGEIEIATASWPKGHTSPTTAVICHPHPLFGGTLDNKVVSTIAKAFQNNGLNTVRFNFRGVGKSTGDFDGGKGEQADLLAVLQWVRTKRPQDKIWLAGFSFGTYIAFTVAQTWPTEGLILVAPPVQHFDYQACDGFHTPVLLIQGDADDIVPPEPVFRWAKQQKFPLKTVRLPGVGHFFHGHLMGLRKIVEEYVSKL